MENLHTDHHVNALNVYLPEQARGLSQIEEYVILEHNGQRREVRLHDYAQIYAVAGLYEKILDDMLKCESPQVIAMLLIDALAREQSDVANLNVFEIGAGVGMVAEELHRKGVQRIIGIDIVPEAEIAARRDRPGMYERYYTADLLNLSDQQHAELESADLNCLICASALGLHHIPNAVFSAGYNMIARNGWVTFNVNEQYFNDRQVEGFPRLIHSLIDHGLFEVKVSHTYRHRLAVDGSPINYVAMVGRKRDDIPPELIG